MRIITDFESLMQAQSLAQSAAQVAHEAAPYPQDSDVFKSLAKLSNAFSSAALRCLESAIEPAPTEEKPAATEPEPAEEPEPTLLAPAEPEGEAPPEPSA